MANCCRVSDDEKDSCRASILFLALLASLLGSVQTGKAQQFSSSVYIRPDGSVDPSTAPIRHGRDTYRFTDNLFNSLVVERNNIVIDGGGFTLQGPGIEAKTVAINLTCTNTIVRNFNIKGWTTGVLGVFNNNTISNNNFTSNARDVAIYADDYNVIGNHIVHIAGTVFRIVGKNNVISQNQIHSLTYSTAFWITLSSGTVIEANDVTLNKLSTFFISTDNGDFRVYHNNFLNVEENTGGYLLLIFSYPQRTNATSPPWDNGYPSGGNYWSDYVGRNPNAKEIGKSGIGDTPYGSSASPSGWIDTHSLRHLTPLLCQRPLHQEYRFCHR
jgi:hypothetical protein